MKKLNKKLFFVIYSLLSLFVISILIIFNYQDYQREYKSIESILSRMNGIHDKLEKEPRPNVKPNEKDSPNIKNDLNSRIFMDSIVYTVMLENNKIKDVLSHTDDNSNDTYKIVMIAENILKEKEIFKIYNLYFSKYSYSINEDVITIVDNSLIKERLYSKLITSIIIFLLLELIIIFVSKMLTKWLLKPVEETFIKQKQFIEDASHELKTPISVILANAEMIVENKNNSKWLNNIKSESLRMNELVIDLLSLAKLENEKCEFKEVNLENLIEKTLLSFESLMYENDIKLEYHLENVLFKCDSEKLKQLLIILLDNAIKHSSKKGKVIINLNKIKNEVILEVKNKGKEIPIEIREKIFERFYRGDQARNRNDNRYGLGLAIAKGIVELHNGKIMVDYDDGYTVFKVIMKQA